MGSLTFLIYFWQWLYVEFAQAGCDKGDIVETTGNRVNRFAMFWGQGEVVLYIKAPPPQVNEYLRFDEVCLMARGMASPLFKEYVIFDEVPITLRRYENNSRLCETQGFQVNTENSRDV